MKGVTYDAGALIAAERGMRSMWRLHEQIVDLGIEPVVISCVLAETWRGGPQASLARLLLGCVVVPFTEDDARKTGALAKRLRGRRTSIVDIAVVEGALRRNHVVVTSDPHDLRAIASAAGRAIAIELV